LHQKQAQSILHYIPTNQRVVAPGDGWGVVKGASKKHVILSTDLVRGVDHTESVEQTLDRMVKGDVLILSYVWNLLTMETRQRISLLLNEVIIIDAYPYLNGFFRVGEGIFTKSIYPWFPNTGLDFTPEGFHEQALAFSENLLNIETRSGLVKTNAYQYHKTMRPFAKESKFGTVICSTIEEAMLHRKLLPYLAPIGRYYSEPWDTEVGPQVSWTTRQLYRLPRESNEQVIRYIRKKSHWCLDKDFFSLLLFFSYTDIFEVFC